MSFLTRLFRWFSPKKAVASLDHLSVSPGIAKDMGVHVTRIPLASGGEKLVIERAVHDGAE